MNPATIALLAYDPLEGAAVRGTVSLDLGERTARSRWAMQLDAALRDQPGGVIAVADGLAAVALAYWMQLSPRSYLACLYGAVLHAPAGAARCAAAGLGTLPATRLPVPAIVVGRAGEYAARHLWLADRWGARFVPDHQLARASAVGMVEERLLHFARIGSAGEQALPLGRAAVPPPHLRLLR